MNSVNLVGRLTKDPVLKHVQVNGEDKEVCEFFVAARRKNSPDANFINCSAWGKLGINLVKFNKKGSLVGVTGEVASRTYEKEGEPKRYITFVLCDSIEYLTNGSDRKQTEEEGDEIKPGEKTMSDYDKDHLGKPIEDDLPF